MEAKIYECVRALQSKEITLSIAESLRLKNALYFHDHLMGHIDLVERRLLKGETIGHEEKVFSLFEPHTALIKKGKSRPAVEFGRRLLVSTQQDGLVLDYKVMGNGSETGEVVPLVDRLLNSYGEGNLQSIRFDKGFNGYKRYVGLGVLAYNLDKIGLRILRNQATADPPQRKKAA